MSSFVSKNCRACIAASGFEHLVSGIREHIGRPHALQHVVVDNKNEGLGG